MKEVVVQSPYVEQKLYTQKNLFRLLYNGEVLVRFLKMLVLHNNLMCIVFMLTCQTIEQ